MSPETDPGAETDALKKRPHEGSNFGPLDGSCLTVERSNQLSYEDIG